MVGQPHQNFMKMASWSSVSEHLVNPIGMSDQLKWNNHPIIKEQYFLFFNTRYISWLTLFISCKKSLYSSKDKSVDKLLLYLIMFA